MSILGDTKFYFLKYSIMIGEKFSRLIWEANLIGHKIYLKLSTNNLNKMSALLSGLFSLRLPYKSPVETNIQPDHLIFYE